MAEVAAAQEGRGRGPIQGEADLPGAARRLKAGRGVIRKQLIRNRLRNKAGRIAIPTCPEN